jgi:xylose isomerase
MPNFNTSNYGGLVSEILTQPVLRYDGSCQQAVNLKSTFSLVKFLEDVGYAGSRHFNAHAYRSEDTEGVKDFARALPDP